MLMISDDLKENMFGFMKCGEHKLTALRLSRHVQNAEFDGL